MKNSSATYNNNQKEKKKAGPKPSTRTDAGWHNLHAMEGDNSIRIFPDCYNKNNEELLMWIGFFADNDGYLRCKMNKREFCLNDGEHILCKIYLCRIRMLPSRHVSFAWKMQRSHAWPIDGVACILSRYEQLETVHSLRVDFFKNHMEGKLEGEVLVNQFFQDKRDQGNTTIGSRAAGNRKRRGRRSNVQQWWWQLPADRGKQWQKTEHTVLISPDKCYT